MTICSKCNKEKKTDFRKHRTVCRVCDNLLAREKRKKDKELTKTNKPSEILCKKCNKREKICRSSSKKKEKWLSSSRNNFYSAS